MQEDAYDTYEEVTSPVSNPASPIEAEVSGPKPVNVPPATSPQGSHGHGTRVEPFGEGFKITLRTAFLQVELLTYGAAINSVRVRNTDKPPESPEAWQETCLGYTSPDECADPSAALGATIGRYAGRIAGGEFPLKGTDYKLMQNENENTLHGGPQGFQKKQWKYIVVDGDNEIGVSFHLSSPHLDQGFPGDLHVTATYTISKEAPKLTVVFKSSLSDTSKADVTVVNLTNHVYWNLNGVVRPLYPGATAAVPETVHNHEMKLNAMYFAETDSELIPTGELFPVANTAHDYSTMRSIREGIESTKDLGRATGGYDDPMALDTWDSSLREAVVLFSPKTKLQMSVWTTNPVVVVYTANHLPEEVDGSKGQRFPRFGGVALECQYFPNSPNMEQFPTTTLMKGEVYTETTTYCFKYIKATK